MARKEVKNFWDDIQHFRKDEWVKDPDKAAPDLVKLLDTIRARSKLICKGGIPIIIHVCWDDGGHEDKSYHYTGQAVDFHFKSEGQKMLDEAMHLMSFPQIGGIGIYPQWRPRPGWHIDIRQSVPAKLWTYRDGAYEYGPKSFVDGLVLAGNLSGR